MADGVRTQLETPESAFVSKVPPDCVRSVHGLRPMAPAGSSSGASSRSLRSSEKARSPPALSPPMMIFSGATPLSTSQV